MELAPFHPCITNATLISYVDFGGGIAQVDTVVSG